MATLVPPVDLLRITESLEVAHTILRRKRDYDLVQKTMILQGYFELSQMNPDRKYDDKIRKAFDDLTALIHLHTPTDNEMARTVAELSEEARRIESLVRVVDESLADPHTSLSEALRLGDWCRQMEGYLEGIRFALGEGKNPVPETPSSGGSMHPKQISNVVWWTGC